MNTATWDRDSTELVKKMYLMPEGITILSKMLSMTPQQITNKAYAIGLSRKQERIKEYVKSRTYRDPVPTPACINEGICPRCKGMILYERVVGVGYDAFCICGGRYPLRS
jgi:hypothetical protein